MFYIKNYARSNLNVCADLVVVVGVSMVGGVVIVAESGVGHHGEGPQDRRYGRWAPALRGRDKNRRVSRPLTCRKLVHKLEHNPTERDTTQRNTRATNTATDHKEHQRGTKKRKEDGRIITDNEYHKSSQYDVFS